MRKLKAARPMHPYIVLVAAVLLPGAGQVINRMPTRAFIMLFFMLSLGFVTMQLDRPGDRLSAAMQATCSSTRSP